MFKKAMSKRVSNILSFAMIFTIVAPNQVIWANNTEENASSEGELIISEYVHAKGTSKALELYNASKNPINLENYNLGSYINGSESPITHELQANVINPGETYVVAGINASDAEFTAKIDDLLSKGKGERTNSKVLTFNGDDLIVLREEDQNSEYKIVDSFGAKTQRDDKYYTGRVSAQRKDEIKTGESNIDKTPFDINEQWNVIKEEEVDSLIANLGVHLGSGDSNPSPQPPSIPEGYISIGDAIKQPQGTEVSITGVVSFNDRGQTIYIQDDSGAIAISNYDSKVDLSKATNGIEVRVTGKLKPFNNMIQVQASEIEVGEEKGMPTPIVKTIKELKENNFDSHYVEIKKATLDIEKKTLTQGDDVLDIYFVPTDLEVKTGDVVDVKATMGRFKDTVQLYGSSATFTKVGEETPEPEPEPEPTPEQGPTINKYLPNSNDILESGSNPVIEVHYSDEKGIDTSSVKVFIDSKEVTEGLEITEKYVKYPVKSSLSDGSHNVKVQVNNKDGIETVHEWTFRVGNMGHFVGQLHSHTNISDGSGSLQEAYDWAKNKGNADFYAVTDHSNWFDNDTSANLFDGSASTAWKNAQEVANSYNKDNEFSAMYGYEMTWSGSTGGWGHINTFNTPGFETRTNKAMDLKTYYDTISKATESISQLNHPGKTFGDFGDFGFYNPLTDKVVNLVEVGNGEGPVKGSGYFPSYEYYTRALDKGWHVAPTNNQDNHKKGWMTSNDARTVIVSPENTKESLYQSMRDKMVYASEDKNMTIEYMVNGKMMGATLGEDVDKLNISISVNDTDSSDAIDKVSIIANGGVEVASKKFDSNTAKWELELDPEYTYYYVKVEQKDRDVLVSSPVWVGEGFNAGFNEPSVDKSIPLKGEELNATFEFYNNNTEELKDINIEFFNNEMSEANKIDTKSISSLKPGTAEKFEISVVPQKLGEQTIWAKATFNADGNQKVITKSVKFNVSDPESVHRVMIDGSKGNQYVTGHYEGNVTGLIEEFAKRNCLAEINHNPITKESLKKVELLIITDPEGKGEKKGNYSKEEIEAIKEYVESGKDIIVSTRADYGDAKDEYSNSAQVNPILEAIGTQIRVNDDQVTDNDDNEGQPYRLMFNKYNSPNYDLVKGLTETDQYSFYSGASVVLAEGASGEGVDHLVKGHDTTEGVNQDGDDDSVQVEKGNVTVLAAEELPSGGKVVVSGNTFLSDFEIDGENQKQKSNMKILSQIFDWTLPKEELQKLSIAEFRKDADKDGVPDLMGQEFVIEGTVTSQSEAVQPKNSFFEVIYIQDETGGLNVFGVSATPIQVGQKVRVKGVVDMYQGEFEMNINNELEDLQIIDESINLIAPTKMTTEDSMLHENEGILTEVVGKVTKMDDSNLYINDGSGESRVYLEGYIGDGKTDDSKGKFNQEIKVGDRVSAIGITSEDPEGNRMRVRNTLEVKLAEEEAPSPEPGPTDPKPEETPSPEPGPTDPKPEETPNPEPGPTDPKPEETPSPEPGPTDPKPEETPSPEPGPTDPKPEETPNPEPGPTDPKPEETPSPEPGTTGSKPQSKPDKNNSPQTGDAGLLASSILVIGCSAGLITLNRKRK